MILVTASVALTAANELTTFLLTLPTNALCPL